MIENILDELQYGVALCKNDGSLIYLNQSASQIFNCSPRTLLNDNILNFVDPYFTSKIEEVLKSPDSVVQTIGHDFIFFKIKGISSKIFKLKFKKDKNDNLLFTIYDYTTNKLDRDNLIKNISQMNDSITKNNLILKTISNLCKNIFYKNRSCLNDILISLSSTFNFDKSAICFKNGTKHIIYCRKKSDGTYEDGKMDGNEVEHEKNCIIWEKEKYYTDSKELIFKVPCKVTCATTIMNGKDYSNVDIHILKLKLDNNEVVGFLEFVENENFQLSNSDLEILESLSQILAYIINNKEQVLDITNYIKNKLSLKL